MRAFKMHKVVFVLYVLLAHSLRSREQERPDRSQERDIKYDDYDYEDDEEIEKLVHFFWIVASAFQHRHRSHQRQQHRLPACLSIWIGSIHIHTNSHINWLPNWQKLQTITIHNIRHNLHI